MGGYYDYGFEYPYADAAVDSAVGSLAGFMLVFMSVFYLMLFAFSVVTYILYSYGTYSIAKRRGIRNPWLAWIPIGSSWILGSISDQYQYVAKGRVRNRRKVMVGLTIGMFLAIVPLIASVVWAVLSEATGSMNSDATFGAMLAVMLLTYLVMIVLAIILLVFEYIALYDLYASCDPGNAVLYLVLTIFVGVTLPFFVFACRKKDLGMPPRKQAEPAQPVFQPAAQQIAASEEEIGEEAETETPVEAESEENHQS